MNPWKRFHNEFKALMEEEDRIVQQRAVRDCCYAYVTNPDSGEFGCWLENIPSESLQAEYELLATEAGRALCSPVGTLPLRHWHHGLFLDLREGKSSFIRVYSDTGCFIERLFEASTNFCARLDRRTLEKAPMAHEQPRFEPRVPTQRKEVEAGGGEIIRARSERRGAVVMPILRSKSWKRCRWAARAGVSKNSVYDYLSGKRNLSVENRQALAEELGLKPDELPE